MRERGYAAATSKGRVRGRRTPGWSVGIPTPRARRPPAARDAPRRSGGPAGGRRPPPPATPGPIKRIRRTFPTPDPKTLNAFLCRRRDVNDPSPRQRFTHLSGARVSCVPRLTGPDVRLRRLGPEDAEVIAAWGADAQFCRAAGWTVGLSRREHVTFQRRLISEPPADLDRLGVDAPEGPGWWATSRCSAMSPRAGAGLRHWGAPPLAPGRRYGWPARAGLSHGFTRMRLTEIWAEALEANVASVAILRRLGMHETGRGRSGRLRGGAVSLPAVCDLGRRLQRDAALTRARRQHMPDSARAESGGPR